MIIKPINIIKTTSFLLVLTGFILFACEGKKSAPAEDLIVDTVVEELPNSSDLFFLPRH